jgi:hypothetical protein
MAAAAFLMAGMGGKLTLAANCGKGPFNGTGLELAA